MVDDGSRSISRRAVVRGLVAGTAAACAFPGGVAAGGPAFGSAVRKARASMLRARTPSAAGSFAGRAPPRGSTGFIIGAQGELIAGARKDPGPRLELLLMDAKPATAEVLSWDAATGLVLARTDARPPPLVPAAVDVVGLEDWLVALSMHDSGAIEPHAGVVTGGPRPHARADGLLAIKVMVPGEPGSPILTPRGELIAIAIDFGQREVSAVLLSALVPRLRRVVLGPDAAP